MHRSRALRGCPPSQCRAGDALAAVTTADVRDVADDAHDITTARRRVGAKPRRPEERSALVEVVVAAPAGRAETVRRALMTGLGGPTLRALAAAEDKTAAGLASAAAGRAASIGALDTAMRVFTYLLLGVPIRRYKPGRAPMVLELQRANAYWSSDGVGDGKWRSIGETESTTGAVGALPFLMGGAVKLANSKRRNAIAFTTWTNGT